MSDLLMFYGTECIHCHEMNPLVEKLEKELKVKVEKFEIWHNSKNKKLYDTCNTEIHCTGVPYFFDKKSKQGICGAVDYPILKKWAQWK